MNRLKATIFYYRIFCNMRHDLLFTIAIVEATLSMLMGIHARAVD